MQYQDAATHLHQALNVEPDNPEALLELGRSYHPFEWPDEEQLGVLDRAARVVPESLEVATEWPSPAGVPDVRTGGKQPKVGPSPSLSND
jgi:Flp pilus assembly protein TadD